MNRPDDTSLRPSDLPAPDVIYDSGDKGCGELIVLLPGVFRPLPSGAVLGLMNTDPGSPEDLPAWCRMTGNEYLGRCSGEKPLYLIRKP